MIHTDHKQYQIFQASKANLTTQKEYLLLIWLYWPVSHFDTNC